MTASAVPWPFLTDIADIALAAELWRLGRFSRLYAEHFTRFSKSGLPQIECMAGGLEAITFLREFRYVEEALDQLEEHPLLSSINAEFWSFLAEQTYSGDFWCAEDGVELPTSEPYAGFSGKIGHVVLFRAGPLAIFNHMIALAAEMYEISSALTVPVLDGGTQRSFGYGWSLWTADARRIGGCDFATRYRLSLAIGTD